MNGTLCHDCGGTGGAHAESCGMVMSVEPGSDRRGPEPLLWGAEPFPLDDNDIQARTPVHVTQEPSEIEKNQPCLWCGETYWRHREQPYGTSEAPPRMPCLGLRSGFQPKPKLAEVKPLPVRNENQEQLVAGLEEIVRMARAGDLTDILVIWEPRDGAPRPDSRLALGHDSFVTNSWTLGSLLWRVEQWKFRLLSLGHEVRGGK